MLHYALDKGPLALPEGQRHRKTNIIQRFTQHERFSLAKVPVLVVDCSKNLMKDNQYRDEVFEKLNCFTKSLQKHEQ